jgi:hypothetical protein
MTLSINQAAQEAFRRAWRLGISAASACPHPGTRGLFK